MIQERSILNVVDNSGVQKIRVFRILRKKKVAQIGDIVIGSVRKCEPGRSLKKGDIVKAIIVRQRKNFKRKGNIYVRFDENAAILIDEKGNLKGARIFGPIPIDLKEKGFANIVNLAKEIV